MMEQKLFDSHAHLTFARFQKEDWPILLERASLAGVSAMVNVATDSSSLQASFDLACLPTPITIYHAAATPPHDLPAKDDPFFSIVKTAATHGKILAIGETGLDFFHKPDSKHQQHEAFLRYAELAQELQLPLIIHCRDAFHELVPILHTMAGSLKGVLHCFTGTLSDAKALLDLGLYISISGIVTYPKTENLREVVSFLPLDRLLVETDSPYLAPQPCRGKRNEPAFLHHTISTIATIKNLSFESVARATYESASSLFSTS